MGLLVLSILNHQMVFVLANIRCHPVLITLQLAIGGNKIVVSSATLVQCIQKLSRDMYLLFGFQIFHQITQVQPQFVQPVDVYRFPVRFCLQ